MHCEKCQKIPLDLFLPTRGCTHTYPTGRAWLGYFYHSTLEDLEQSSAIGCVMCRLCLNALSTDKSIEGIPVGEPEPKTHVLLRCSAEGRLLVEERLIEEHTMKPLVRSGNLYWVNESMGQGRPREHSVNDSPDSPNVFTLARSWIETCQKEHPVCSRSRDSECIPTRLIDIGSQSSGGNIISRLIHTSGHRKMRGMEYVALSHCWGTAFGGNVPRTTKATLADQYAGISWDQLSKTFQDALMIVRGLGMRYIWIDSLCIVQDDEKDFQIECAKMGLVYSNALCTIAASDSQTSEGGCFISRDRELIKGRLFLTKNVYTDTRGSTLMSPEFGHEEGNPASSNIQIYQDYGTFMNSIKGPLSARGWTLQERELAPRILHYTRDQVLWECRQCIASEVNPKLQEKHKEQLEGSDQNSASWRLLDWTAEKASTATPGEENILTKWYTLVEAYSRRHLTQKQDKLPAISGLAKEVAHVRQSDEYVAGIWKNDLLRGLSWFPDSNNRHRVGKRVWPPPRADESIPSWSWAAFDGPITHYGENWFEAKPKKVHLKALHTTHASSDPFGRVSGGQLCLSGWAIEASVSEIHCQKFDETMFRVKCYRLPNSFKYPSSLRFYFDANPEELPLVDLVFFQLGNGQSVRKMSMDVGLVVMKVHHETRDIYCRVGMFDVEKVDKKWLSLRAERTIRIE